MCKWRVCGRSKLLILRLSGWLIHYMHVGGLRLRRRAGQRGRPSLCILVCIARRRGVHVRLY